MKIKYFKGRPPGQPFCDISTFLYKIDDKNLYYYNKRHKKWEISGYNISDIKYFALHKYLTKEELFLELL